MRHMNVFLSVFSYKSQMSLIVFLIEMHFNCPPWLEKILKCTGLKWLEMHFNCPPLLEKILKCTGLKFEMY